MSTSEYLTEHQLMRCVVEGGPNSGLHLAMLERQQQALATAEKNAMIKDHAVAPTDNGAKRTTPHLLQLRLSHWLGVKLIAAGHRLADSTA